MNETEQLLALQALDTAIDEASNRRLRLPELQAFADARKAVTGAEAKLAKATAEIATATARIEELERLGALRTIKKERLEKQLKTVIASREAEALMHEIARLDEERSTSDDEELALIDAVEAAEAVSAKSSAQIDDGKSVAAVAGDALAGAQAAIDDEIAEFRSVRAGLTADLAESLVARYEKMRKSFGGTVITRIAAGRCGACHLDQSRATIEALRAGDGVTVECEQCGRLLAA